MEQQTGIEADTPEGTPKGGEETDDPSTLLKLVTGAASELNNAIGYLTVAALVVPGGQAVAAMLKGMQTPAAVTASLLQLAKGDPEKAVVELVALIPIDKIPGFDKIAMPFAKKVAEKVGSELAESALKEMTEEQIRVIIQKAVQAANEMGITIDGKTYRLEDLADLDPNVAKELVKEKMGALWSLLTGLLGGEEEEVDPRLAKFRESEFYTALESDELKAGFDYVFKYFIDNAVISESLKDAVLKLGIKPADMRKALMALKDENDPAFKAVVAFLKEEQNVNAFVEAMRQFGLGTDADPEDEQEREPEEQQAPELDDVADIPETEIQVLEKAYSEWVSGFMTAKFLKVQADIFTALWGPIKQFAGKDKEALEQMERAINPATASKEEEEEASAPLDEQEAPPQDEPQEEPQEPQEEKEEFKRSILEGLIVLKRHSTLIEDVLKLYQSQVQGGKVGSSEAFKKYGDGNPRNVIYKFANLIVKDINSILATIAELSPEEQKIAEALLEVEGEKFSDKLRLVKAVNKIVVGETDVLLKILKKTEEKEATSQVQEPEAEQEQENPEQETAMSPCCVKCHRTKL